MADLLLGLPKELSCLVVGTWLDLETVAKLDSAYCHVVKRQALLTVLSVPICSHSRQSKTKSTVGLVEWLYKRSIRVDTLVMKDLNPVYTQYTSIFGIQMQHITLSGLDFNRKQHPDADICTLLQHCTNIASLALTGCSMSHTFLSALLESAHVRSLRELRIVDQYRLIAVPKKTKTIPALAVKLALSKLVLVCDYLIAGSLLQACEPSRLVHLEVSASQYQIQTQLLALLPLCTNLTTLGFHGGVNDQVLAALLVLCPQLKQLDLSKAEALTDASAVCVAQLSRLKALNVSDTYFTDVLATELATHCRNTLEVLNVDFCLSISASGLHNIVNKCRNLRTLYINVQSCASYDFSIVCNLTTLHVNFDDWQDPSAALHRLVAHCSNLQHLHLKLHFVTPKVLAPLNASSFKKLRELHITAIDSSDGFGPRSRGVIRDTLIPQLPRTVIVLSA